MKRSEETSRLLSFLEVHGFTLVLSICLVAVCVSAYLLFFSGIGRQETAEPVLQQVSYAPIPSAEPSASSIPEEPSPTPVPTSTPSPTPAPSAEASAKPSEAPAESQATLFVWPVNGDVVTAFSPDELAYDKTLGDWRVHQGIDIASALGTRVNAMADGNVVSVYSDSLMGTTVILDHGDGLQSIYSNLQAEATVAEGDTVACGQVIGAVGETALSEWGIVPHLHLETTRDGEAVDPLSLLSSTKD